MLNLEVKINSCRNRGTKLDRVINAELVRTAMDPRGRTRVNTCIDQVE